MTTRLRPLMLAVVIAWGSTCAKPDWIQQILVTVDVRAFAKQLKAQGTRHLRPLFVKLRRETRGQPHHR